MCSLQKQILSFSISDVSFKCISDTSCGSIFYKEKMCLISRETFLMERIYSLQEQTYSGANSFLQEYSPVSQSGKQKKMARECNSNIYI